MIWTTPAGKWLRFSLLNLLIVAVLGVLMRYKIGFEFPHFDQKNIQHAHSHFAFAGWIAHTLYTLIYYTCNKHILLQQKGRFSWLIPANLLSAYGMLISFFVQGYGPVSIFFSTSSVLISLLFTIYYFRVNPSLHAHDPSIKWIKVALLFNVFSALGTFMLAYMMMTKQLEQTKYLASVYFYLHFQYNGWFTLASIGLFIGLLYKKEIYLKDSSAFWLLVSSCVPAYFLSTLWYPLPVTVYGLTVAAAVAQAIGWGLFLRLLWKSKRVLRAKLQYEALALFVLAAVAMTIKFSLQLGSTIPEISKLAFGFRPIVIAYLHLVLLGVVTIFLLAYLQSGKAFTTARWHRIGLTLFVGGIFLNEVILMIQGMASFGYVIIPLTNESLLLVSLVMLVGIALIVTHSFAVQKNMHENRQL